MHWGSQEVEEEEVGVLVGRLVLVEDDDADENVVVLLAEDVEVLLEVEDEAELVIAVVEVELVVLEVLDEVVTGEVLLVVFDADGALVVVVVTWVVLVELVVEGLAELEVVVLLTLLIDEEDSGVIVVDDDAAKEVEFDDADEAEEDVGITREGGGTVEMELVVDVEVVLGVPRSIIPEKPISTAPRAAIRAVRPLLSPLRSFDMNPTLSYRIVALS